MSNTDTSAVARATRVVKLISATLWAVSLGLSVRARIRQEREEASPSKRTASTFREAMNSLSEELAKAARAASEAQRKAQQEAAERAAKRES